jgi:hypothetical protein
MRGTLRPIRIDRCTNLIERGEVERYRREHLGQAGRRKTTTQPARPAEETTG